MAGGRPTTYNDEVLALAQAYLNDGWKETGAAIPSIVGLCRYIGRSRASVYKWRDDGDKPEFSDILSQIDDYQLETLLTNGLNNSFNAQITKLVLGKHGFHDKQDLDHKSSDGTMTPKIYSPEQYKQAEDNLGGKFNDLD